MSTFDDEPVLKQRPNGAWQQPVFDLVDTRLERVPDVVVADRQGLLQHDRAGVDPLVDEVHRDAGDLDTVGQGVAHTVHAGERGQQRRVDVQPSVTPALDDRRPEDAHVAGARDQSMPRASSASATAIVSSARSPVGSITRLSTPPSAARCKAKTPGRSDRTSERCGRIAASSRSACRFGSRSRDQHRNTSTHGCRHAIRAWSRAGQGR